MRILVSAGEASGDMYAAQLVRALHSQYGDAEYFGCTGPRLREAGVQTVIDAASLSVVGLAEVMAHLPRIYGEYRRLLRFIKQHPPDAAILTDSPDFHLRLARHLKRMGVPVFYLVAPQVWAWRQGRVRIIRDRVRRLFCLFPFEEPWFRSRGVNADYIGHPLATMVRPRIDRDEFFARYQLRQNVPVLSLLPGSRAGEAARHLPDLLDAVALLQQKFHLQVLLATPRGFEKRGALATFRERFSALSIKVIEDEAWEVLAYSEVALAASGTVTVEAAVLGTPMVTYYKVTELSWWAGQRLVKVPYLSMVNLIASRQVVPELIQHDMTPENLATATATLLEDVSARTKMRADLLAIRTALTGPSDPFVRAASLLAADLGHGIK